MGKKKKQKAAAEAEPTLSKKERKAAEARAAEIAAELERRERKAAKKGAGKKSKKKGKDKPVDLSKLADDLYGEDPRAGQDFDYAQQQADAAERHPHLQHLDRVGELVAIVDNPDSSKKERKAAQAELDKLRAEGDAINRADPNDEEIRKRVQRKQAAREAGHDAVVAEAATIDRSDAQAVAEYNDRAVAVGATLLTSDAEHEKMAAAVEAETAPAAPAQTAAEVQTEDGREFVVGESVATAPDVAPDATFAKPSDAPRRMEDRTNGLNQYLITDPAGKERGYTRATTFIKGIEDTSSLEKWKQRIILEGVAAIEMPDPATDREKHESVVARISELAHRRDVTIAKARKADRKEKLQRGELKAITDRAWKEFKDALNKIADEVFEIGGGREKAQKGTDLHALCQLYLEQGIGVIGDKLQAGEITPADFADVEAFADAMRRLGAKIIDIERVVVDDERKVAGRLDLTAMVKLPELRNPKTKEVISSAEVRARRRVMDIKTGNVEYSILSIAQQLAQYAGSEGYDEKTHDRDKLGLDQAYGILIHLPAGSGKATIHVVDLAVGRKANKIITEIRAMRNEGRRAIDLKLDVLEAIAATEEQGAQ